MITSEIPVFLPQCSWLYISSALPVAVVPTGYWEQSLAQGSPGTVPSQLGELWLGTSQQGAREQASGQANGWPAGQRLSSFPEHILIRTVAENTEIPCSLCAWTDEHSFSVCVFAPQSTWLQMIHGNTSYRRPSHQFVQWELQVLLLIYGMSSIKNKSGLENQVLNFIILYFIYVT